MSNHLSEHHKAYCTYIEMYIQIYDAMCHMDTWENFDRNKTYLFCYQKDCIGSRSVSVHSYLSYDALCAHRRGCGDKQKN